MEISTLLSYARSRLESARESLHYAAFWDPMQRSPEYALAVDEYRRAQAEMDRVQELARSAFAPHPHRERGGEAVRDTCCRWGCSQRATIRRRIGRYMLLRFCDLHVPKEPHP